MEIPKEIDRYIVKDELLEKQFSLSGIFEIKGTNVYATNKRLFVKRGNTIRDISYDHISSIMMKETRNWLYILLGYLLVLIGVVSLWIHPDIIMNIIPEWSMLLLLFIGLIIIVIGFVPRQQIELTVVGMTEPYKLSGKKVNLELLYKYIREKRI